MADNRARPVVAMFAEYTEFGEQRFSLQIWRRKATICLPTSPRNFSANFHPFNNASLYAYEKKTYNEIAQQKISEYPLQLPGSIS